ncbi:MAG: exodeoxyribonuclease III [Candidatus Hydrogenedentes bacterium]|nr:exodeoxyribonuclease III [Candidatus Hydrogenedentota bacterium]
MKRLISWNVNGIRAAGRNGFLEWLDREKPDVVCVQEIKANSDDVPQDLREPKGYASVWQPAKKKGYSGVATYFRVKSEPLSVATMGIGEFDDEGRVQLVEYKDFTVVNAYYPNAQAERARLDYKLGFCKAMLKLCNKLRKAGTNLVICGDYNIAHKEIDLARPKDNRNSPGFYPEECACMDEFVQAGYVDTFRHFNPNPGHYTWWSYRSRAREKNIGWRIDYHCVNAEFLPKVKSAHIHADIMGSDHCPVSITVN